MSLISALNIGSAGLAAQQAAIQVTGNNIANVSDPSYSREVTTLAPNADQELQPGIFAGTGVDLSGITQQIDEALQARLNNATSDDQAANTTAGLMGQIQTTFNALGGSDIGASMSTFFNDWSSLANSPQDQGLRQVVLQDGATLAQKFQSTRSSLDDLEQSDSTQIQSLTSNANQLSTQIAQLNGQILTEEAGSGGTANDLRDQRTADLTQLAQLVDVKTVQQSNGVVNVYSGSQPLVVGTQSLGLTTKQSSANGVVTSVLALQTGGETLNTTSGQIGGLISMQAQIQQTVGQVDTLAQNLISAVNQIHASGQGLQGFTSISASNTVADNTVALNDPATGLAFTPTNGSFVVHVTDTATGLQTTTLVPVQLTGSPGDTTLNSLTASLNGITGVTATDSGGRLKITAAGGTQISFSQDSSGVLSALGVNTFFTGSNSGNIAVNTTLQNNPSLLAAAQNGQPDDNQTALAIAGLQTQTLTSLNGSTLEGSYQNLINGIGETTSTAQNNATATSSVMNALQSQRDSISGVSIDEETVNLIQEQGAYQGAARLITVLSQMLQTLMAM